jgi:predicted nucleic acid-binding protein
MAPDRWVVNASPLILLGKAEQIELLGALAGEVAVPKAVIREVSAKPDGERTVQTLATIESAIFVDDEVPPVNILSWDLGHGETQVIFSDAYALKKWRGILPRTGTSNLSRCPKVCTYPDQAWT